MQAAPSKSSSVSQNSNEKSSSQAQPSSFPAKSSEDGVGHATPCGKATQARKLASIPKLTSYCQGILLEAVRSVDVIPIGPLLSSVLRPISPRDILQVKNLLLENGSISEKFGWKDFHETLVERPNGSLQPSTFKPLERMYADILDAAITFQVLQNQDNLLDPLSFDGDKKSGSKQYNQPEPDGYLYLKNSTLGSGNEETIDYADVVLFMGLKSKNNIADRRDVSASIHSVTQMLTWPQYRMPRKCCGI
jgi:hypothetical protein